MKVLLRDKQEIEVLFNKRKYDIYIFIGVKVLFFLFVLFIVYMYIRNKNIYRLKFQEVMKKKEILFEFDIKSGNNGIGDISKDIVVVILK